MNYVWESREGTKIKRKLFSIAKDIAVEIIIHIVVVWQDYILMYKKSHKLPIF